MKSLLITTITLLACATQIFCAAPSSSSSIEAAPKLVWTKNPRLACTVAYQIGTDGYGLRAYHEPQKLTNYECFGFALVKTTTPSLGCVSSDGFSQLDKASFFEIKQNICLNVSAPSTSAARLPIPDLLNVTSYAATTAPVKLSYVMDFSKSDDPHRFLFVSNNLEHNATIPKLLQENRGALTTLAAAASFLHSRMPTTTFVLFDVVDYGINIVNVWPGYFRN